MICPMRGEIWLTNFEPSVGTEYQKNRPTLMISNDVANARATRVTVIPLTGTTRRMAIVIVEPDKGNGLDKQNLIRIPDICTFDKARLKKRVGVIGKDKMNEVDKKLRLHLAL